MHIASRQKVVDASGGLSYDTIYEYIARNFPGYEIAHVKTNDYGDAGYTDGVHNTISYIQLRRSESSSVSNTFNYGFLDASDLPFA
jgi:hypothetical protein